MVSNTGFKTGKNDFQKNLVSDLWKIETTKNALEFGDKTKKNYEMSPDQYNYLLKNNITKTYRKAEFINKTRINKETIKL